MWRARLESQLRTLFRKSTDSQVETRILPEIMNCPLTGKLSGQRSLVWPFRNVCKKSVSVNPLCTPVRDEVLEELIYAVIILTTRCIFTVQSIATQVISKSQFLCVFQQGRKGRGRVVALDATALQGPVPLSPQFPWEKRWGFLPEWLHWRCKAECIKQYSAQNQTLAARGALNRCQHSLHTEDRVVLSGDIKRF